MPLRPPGVMRLDVVAMRSLREHASRLGTLGQWQDLAIEWMEKAEVVVGQLQDDRDRWQNSSEGYRQELLRYRREEEDGDREPLSQAVRFEGTELVCEVGKLRERQPVLFLFEGQERLVLRSQVARVSLFLQERTVPVAGLPEIVKIKELMDGAFG